MKFFFVFFTMLFISINAFAEKENYTVEIDHINKILHIKSCYKQAPLYLYTKSREAEKLIYNIKWQEQKVRPYNRTINLPKGKQGCVTYSVNSKLHNSRLNNSTIDQQHPYDTILEISDWLWISDQYNPSYQANITFKHDLGVNVSTPWQLKYRNKTTTEYLMQYTPDSWVGYVGFGEFDIIELNSNLSKINLAIINGKNEYNPSNITDWIEQMVAAVSKISNGFPIKEVQVMVLLVSDTRDAVPWGQVNRQGGPGVFLVVNPDKPQYEIISDWTAAHEFSHLLLPYTPDDRWLSEGFASYHQNISRARIGLLDEKSTWEKLLAGFDRGKKTAEKNNAPVLKYAKGRNRMQMYWGGAVIALKADVALQIQTNGRFTLSKALEKLSHCCLDTSQAWSAGQTFSELDKITDTDIFTQLYRQEVKQKSYPSYQKLLDELGVKQNSYGRISLDNTAKNAHIRKKIING